MYQIYAIIIVHMFIFIIYEQYFLRSITRKLTITRSIGALLMSISNFTFATTDSAFPCRIHAISFNYRYNFFFRLTPSFRVLTTDISSFNCTYVNTYVVFQSDQFPDECRSNVFPPLSLRSQESVKQFTIDILNEYSLQITRACFIDGSQYNYRHIAT